MADDIRPLPMRHNVGRALTHDEELRLLKLAAAKPEWLNARLAAVVALNTTMRAGEIRGLRWQVVDFIERTITVQRNTTKTDAGERVIPLNAGALAAMLELRERAKLLFGVEPQPEWYVFPHKEGFTKPDPTRPMSGWRTAWRNLTRAIYCPACGHLQQPAERCRNEKCEADIRGVRSPLHSFRFHDCRHHSITRLCEAQANDSIIREIAGPGQCSSQRERAYMFLQRVGSAEYTGAAKHIRHLRGLDGTFANTGSGRLRRSEGDP